VLGRCALIRKVILALAIPVGGVVPAQARDGHEGRGGHEGFERREFHNVHGHAPYGFCAYPLELLAAGRLLGVSALRGRMGSLYLRAAVGAGPLRVLLTHWLSLSCAGPNRP
jgi:hypothetical protein